METTAKCPICSGEPADAFERARRVAVEGMVVGENKMALTTAESALALWNSGVDSDAEIARQLGVSRQRINQVLGPLKSRNPNPVTGKTAAFLRPCGTPASYRRGCRCEKCREAWRLKAEQYRRQLGVPPNPHYGGLRHGTPSGYGYWGCRCAECRQGHALRMREYLRKKGAEKGGGG